MSHHNPLLASANLFEALGDIGCGTAGLGMALQAVDMERIEDPGTFISAIGHLVETIGGAVLETSCNGKRHADEALKKLAA